MHDSYTHWLFLVLALIAVAILTWSWIYEAHKERTRAKHGSRKIVRVNGRRWE